MPLPLPTRYIDIRTGQLLSGLGGLPAAPFVFSQGDIFTLPIGFCEGATDKGDLATGTGTATIATTLRARPGGDILAQSTSYTYAAAIASLAVNLNTTELDDYFSEIVPFGSASMVFEVRVTLSGQVFAYYSAACAVLRSIYGEGGGATAAAAGGWVPAFTTQAALLAIATTTIATGTIIQGTISGVFMTVQLADGSQTTGGGYYRPDDYNASTNQRVWVQLQ